MSNNTLKFFYTNANKEKSERVILPVSLKLSSTNRWLLVAFDQTSRSTKSFALDQLQRCEDENEIEALKRCLRYHYQSMLETDHGKESQDQLFELTKKLLEID